MGGNPWQREASEIPLWPGSEVNRGATGTWSVLPAVPGPTPTTHPRSGYIRLRSTRRYSGERRRSRLEVELTSTGTSSCRHLENHGRRQSVRHWLPLFADLLRRGLDVDWLNDCDDTCRIAHRLPTSASVIRIRLADSGETGRYARNCSRLASGERSVGTASATSTSSAVTSFRSDGCRPRARPSDTA